MPPNFLEHLTKKTKKKLILQKKPEIRGNYEPLPCLYQVGYEMACDYYNVTKTSNVKQWSNIPPPPRAQLNDHNINNIHKALFEVHIISDLLF